MISIGSLCTGYGGLDIAVADHWASETSWVSDNDPYVCEWLDLRLPGIPNIGDVREVDWSAVPEVDVLTAGYPCQPFSNIGKHAGVNDPRHLWPYLYQAIRYLRPPVIFLENVYGHLKHGFGDVLGDLAESGYDVRWICLPAAGAGAPHQRERLFALATSTDPSHQRRQRSWQPGPRRFQEPPDGDPGPAASPREWWREYHPAIRRWERLLGRPAPEPWSPSMRAANGWTLSARFVEWLMGLPEDFIIGAPFKRKFKMQMLGNGVVPQQASLALRILKGEL